MRRVVSVSARAFISPRNKCGGNPVNIFLFSGPTTSSERIKLARTCSWESIVIETENGPGTLPKFYFYMPSGVEVSFCCHAAIGACAVLTNDELAVSSEETLQENFRSSMTTVSFTTAEEGLKYDATVTGNEVQLITDALHHESECNSQSFSLEEFLFELGLDVSDVTKQVDSGFRWPTFINTSIARPKTIIPIASLERLHAATPPNNPVQFREMCDSIDSTGIYLYSTSTRGDHVEDCLFECRQFPRFSGYSEDPATGIAAGALAASFHKRQSAYSRGKFWGDSNYTVVQGTSMGRPSKINVKICNYPSEETDPNPPLKVIYNGAVAVDAVSFLDLAQET